MKNAIPNWAQFAAFDCVSAMRPTFAFARIITIIAIERLEISDTKLFSRRRTEPMNSQRQIIWYFIRRMTTLSYPQIALLFSRHHSTVIYGINKIREARRQRGTYDYDYEEEISRTCALLENTYAQSRAVQCIVDERRNTAGLYTIARKSA